MGDESVSPGAAAITPQRVVTNALSQADITWQLEGMAGQGMGGVEIMSLWKMYEKGNVEYLTPEFLGLVKHAVAEAKRLGMEVAITFSPGWGFGGAWVPQADQSKVLCLANKVQAVQHMVR